MTGIINLTKKAIGIVHRPTMISAIEDEIQEHLDYIRIFENALEGHRKQVAIKRKKLEELKRK